MPHPIVSIIIPTYNRTDYLKKTLESIQDQTFQDYEVLVIDDGTVGNENEDLCKKFEKVHYQKIKNFGSPARPRNIGIQNAKGKYIAFVDDDDLWKPEKLEKQVAVLDQNEDFGIIHGPCEVIDEHGVFQNKIVGRPSNSGVKHGEVSLKMIGNWTIMMPTVMVRKQVLDIVGYFNEIMPPAGEDVEYWSRCSFETKFYYLDEPLVYYRVHSNGISIGKEKYRKLPYYLKLVLVKQKEAKKISNRQYNQLVGSMCINQINYIKEHYKLTLAILSELDTMWLFRFKNFKCLIYNLFFKK